jgi:transcriptional regulator with GAF, ATPase, and Fis domain
LIQQNEKLTADLIKSSQILTKDLNIAKVIISILEQSREITKSDLACFYKHDKSKVSADNYKLSIKKGEYEVDDYIFSDNEFINFIKECRESIVILERKTGPFIDILLNRFMNSGIALPLLAEDKLFGIIILNSSEVNFYNHDKFLFLESLNKTANNIFKNLLLLNNKK